MDSRPCACTTYHYMHSTNERSNEAIPDLLCISFLAFMHFQSCSEIGRIVAVHEVLICKKGHGFRSCPWDASLAGLREQSGYCVIGCDREAIIEARIRLGLGFQVDVRSRLKTTERVRLPCVLLLPFREHVWDNMDCKWCDDLGGRTRTSATSRVEYHVRLASYSILYALGPLCSFIDSVCKYQEHLLW